MKQPSRRLDEALGSPREEPAPRVRSLRPVAVGPYAPQLIRLVRQPATLSGAPPKRVQVRPVRERLGGVSS